MAPGQKPVVAQLDQTSFEPGQHTVQRTGIETLPPPGARVVAPNIPTELLGEPKPNENTIPFYDERQLLKLLESWGEKAPTVMLTTLPVDPQVIGALQALGFRWSRNHQLHFFSTKDPNPGLTHNDKVARNPALRDALKQYEGGTLDPFYGFDHDQALADKLGLTMVESVEAQSFGRKAKGRELFVTAGVSTPDGTPLAHTTVGLAQNVAELLGRNPGARKMVLKLDEGASGDGNAVLNAAELHLKPGETKQAQLERIVAALPGAERAQNVSWADFERRTQSLGALAEMWVDGEDKTSPSVQGFIHADGRVEVVSTHEQLLDGQKYLGAIYPANEEYRAQLLEAGARIGAELSKNGARGRFAVDFVAARQGDQHQLNAIEINLREGGTTHPFVAIRAVAGARAAGPGQLQDKHGRPLSYLVTDTVKKRDYIGLSPSDLTHLFEREGLLYDDETGRGAVPHMMGALKNHGLFGATFIAPTPQEAQALHDRALAVLDAHVGANQQQPGRRVSPGAQRVDFRAETPWPDGVTTRAAERATIELIGRKADALDWAETAAFSADGSVVAAATNRQGDHRAVVLSTTDGAEAWSTIDHGSSVRATVFDGAGRLVTGTADGRVRLFEPHVTEPVATLSGPKGLINAVTTFDGGRGVAAGDSEGNVWLWQPAQPKAKAIRVPGEHGWVRALTEVSDGVLVGYADGAICHVGAAGKRSDFLLPADGEPGAVTAVALSPDGGQVAIAREDKSVTVVSWPDPNRGPPRHLALDWLPKAMTFGPNGTLAITCADETVRLWHPEKNEAANFSASGLEVQREGVCVPFAVGAPRVAEDGSVQQVSAAGSITRFRPERA